MSGSDVDAAAIGRRVARPAPSTAASLITSIAVIATGAQLAGCAVVSLAAAIAGAAIQLAGAVVATGVTVTGKVVGKTIDLVAPGGPPAP